MSNPTDSPSASGQGDTNASPLNYESQVPLVELCRLRLFEADLACAKLQSEGIDAVLHDQRIAVAHPFVFPDVPLMVPENQLAEAREILARPASDLDQDRIADPSAQDPDDGEYIDEPWRCPKCRRKGVELVPMSPARKMLLYSFLATLALPLLFALVGKLFKPAIDEAYGGTVLIVWLALVVIQSFALIFRPSLRRCPHCQHVWKRGMD
jgi:hypothetical protein